MVKYVRLFTHTPNMNQMEGHPRWRRFGEWWSAKLKQWRKPPSRCWPALWPIFLMQLQHHHYHVWIFWRETRRHWQKANPIARCLSQWVVLRWNFQNINHFLPSLHNPWLVEQQPSCPLFVCPSHKQIWSHIQKGVWQAEGSTTYTCSTFSDDRLCNGSDERFEACFSSSKYPCMLLPSMSECLPTGSAAWPESTL